MSRTVARAHSQSEAEFQQQVLDLAQLGGWSAYHTHDSRRSQAGWPDLVLCRPPELIFAELKSETGKVSPEQQQWVDDLNACGQEAVIWRPSDLAPIIIQRLSRRRRSSPTLSR